MLKGKLLPVGSGETTPPSQHETEERSGRDEEASFECPHCGVQNPRAFVFCRNCGELLPQPA